MSRDVSLLHPELIPICEEFVRRCRAAGLNVLVTDTRRSRQEQEALYAQGRTRPGSIITRCRYPYSPHNWGVAFDFCRNVKGREYDDSDGFFAKCGAVGKQLGLFWGGDFRTFVDKPHLELKKFLPNNSCTALIRQYGTPEAFMETWKEDNMSYEQFKIYMQQYEAEKAAQTATWENLPMQEAKEAGIMDGTRPKSHVTRGELAQVLMNLKLV